MPPKENSTPNDPENFVKFLKDLKHGLSEVKKELEQKKESNLKK